MYTSHVVLFIVDFLFGWKHLRWVKNGGHYCFVQVKHIYFGNFCILQFNISFFVIIKYSVLSATRNKCVFFRIYLHFLSLEKILSQKIKKNYRNLFVECLNLKRCICFSRHGITEWKAIKLFLLLSSSLSFSLK